MDAYKKTSYQQPLAVLYQRYTDLVFGVCLKYLKDVELAKDASLDIYEELVAKVKKHEVENFRGWLAVLVRNHCLMKLRNPKNRATVALPAHFMQLEDSVHLNGAMDKENKLQQMEQCIETLNKEQQQMVRLFYLQEKCYNEIAEHTGMSWNLVRSHIQNGRRNLKLCMDQHAN